jgi:ketosteroid isomerase-like protein
MATPAAPDHDEIVRVVQLYVDGFNDCDPDKLRTAFHEDAWIFYTDADGALHRNLISESFEEWASPPSDSITARIISVTQAGDVASVLLGFDRVDEGPDASWVDIHALLRIDGAWRITNKTATHNSRAAWAGEGMAQLQSTA